MGNKPFCGRHLGAPDIYSFAASIVLFKRIKSRANQAQFRNTLCADGGFMMWAVFACALLESRSLMRLTSINKSHKM